MSVKNLYQLSKKNTKYVIGLMSGTSLDGIDAVLLQIKGNSTKTKVSQLAFGTYPFPAKMKEMMLGKRLSKLVNEKKVQVSY